MRPRSRTRRVRSRRRARRRASSSTRAPPCAAPPSVRSVQCSSVMSAPHSEHIASFTTYVRQRRMGAAGSIDCGRRSAQPRRRASRSTRGGSMAKEILCAYGIDIDAVAGWLGSYGGEDSPADVSRGLFAGEVGTPRLLKLFDKYDLRTSWFIPGHSIETFPEQTQMVVDAGHEIGMHGYSHENPI